MKTSSAPASDRQTFSHSGSPPCSDAADPTNQSRSNPQPGIQNRKFPTRRRRTGYVARLPQKVRDAICQLLQDGVPYAEILSELGDDVKGISIHNISEWKKGGYQDWLEDQRWTEQMALLRDGASGIVHDCDQLKIHQAAIQLAVIQIFQSLRHQKLNHDPQNYTRMLNALSRLSREALVFTRYQELDRPVPDEEAGQYEEHLRNRLALVHESLLSTLRPLQRAPQPSSSSSSSTQSASTIPKQSEAEPVLRIASDDPSRDPGLVAPNQAQGEFTMATQREAGRQPHNSDQCPPAAVPPDRPDPDSPLSSPIIPATSARPETSDPSPHPEFCQLADPPVEAPLTQTDPSLNSQPSQPSILNPCPIPIPPSENLTNPQPAIRAPHSEESCPSCFRALPARLPNGDRPQPHCAHCGFALRAPEVPIEYCPGCRILLPELAPSGKRPFEQCPECGSSLPPPQPPGSSSHPFNDSTTRPA